MLRATGSPHRNDSLRDELGFIQEEVHGIIGQAAVVLRPVMKIFAPFEEFSSELCFIINIFFALSLRFQSL